MVLENCAPTLIANPPRHTLDAAGADRAAGSRGEREIGLLGSSNSSRASYKLALLHFN